MSNTQFISLQSEFEGKSASYKFLLAGMPKSFEAIKNTQRQEPISEAAVQLVNDDYIDRRRSDSNTSDILLYQREDIKLIENEAVELMSENSLQLSPDSIIQLGSEKPDFDCIRLDIGVDDVLSNSKPDTYLNLSNIQPHAVKIQDNSQLKMTKRSRRKTSVARSLGETVCCENAQKNLNFEDSANEIQASRNNEQKPEWNYFSLRRACFRGMSAYYKDRFNAFTKSFNKQKQGKSG